MLAEVDFLPKCQPCVEALQGDGGTGKSLDELLLDRAERGVASEV